MKLFEKIKKIFTFIEDGFSKEHSCICCGIEIIDGSFAQLCKNCLKKIDKIKEPVCSKCGERLYDGLLQCDYCKEFDYNFDSSRSYCYYDEYSSKIIKGLKYSGKKYFARHIATLMVENKELFDGVDMLVPVPVTTKTKRVRGFNQAEEIANEISKLVGVPVKNVLVKSKDHKHQAGLSQKERLENLKDSFELNKEFENDVKGKTIMVIDDVFTTGATANEVAKVLKKKKPKAIMVYTAAKTKLNSINSAKNW